MSVHASFQVEDIMSENDHIGISSHQFEQLLIHLLEKLKSICSHTGFVPLEVF